MTALINWLDLWLGQKAPQLPPHVKEFFVKTAPYISLVFIILALPGVFLLVSFLGYSSAFFSYLIEMGYNPGMGLASATFIGLELVLEIIALPGLFNRTPSGWNFTFYARIAAAVASALSLYSYGWVLSLLVGLYILFQIRPYYFGAAAMAATPPTQGPATAQTPVQPPQQ